MNDLESRTRVTAESPLSGDQIIHATCKMSPGIATDIPSFIAILVFISRRTR